MTKLIIINEGDGNDVFSASGLTIEDALIDALNQLGWSVIEDDDDGESEDEDDEGA